jgi:hypothetical protein
MTLARDQFNQITVAPGEIAYTQWNYVDGLDHGPQVISASFQGPFSGTATTIKTSVITHPVQTVSYFLYSSQILNDGASAFVMKVNIGDFE